MHFRQDFAKYKIQSVMKAILDCKYFIIPITTKYVLYYFDANSIAVLTVPIFLESFMHIAALHSNVFYLKILLVHYNIALYANRLKSELTY